MKRRSFIGSAVAVGVPGALALSCGRRKPPRDEDKITGVTKSRDIPERIAGATLKELRADYHHRLFNRYLPFWEKGGVDSKYGGFMCLLNEDGTVEDDEKYSVYQGRGLWTYSFLYNNFGKNKYYLDIASKTHDFIVENMYAGNGTWYERVFRDGRMKEGVGDSIIGWLYIAAGLGEFYKAAGDDADYKMALETLWASLRAYDNSLYTGVKNNGVYPSDMDFTGLRSQEHSSVILWMLTQLLGHKRNIKLEEVAAEHIDYLMKGFLHPYLLISNECLQHDYSRIPGFEDYMYTGNSLEAQCIVMFEAIRQGDRALFDTCKNHIRRYIALNWDYIFEGFGDGHFYVFDGPDRTRDRLYGAKSMWSHTEILIAAMHILEYTGEVWAKEWYERARAYCLTHFDSPTGVWRHTVDRFGNDSPREDIPLTLRDNFHQVRYMMLNLLSLERMIGNDGELSYFR